MDKKGMWYYLGQFVGTVLAVGVIAVLIMALIWLFTWAINIFGLIPFIITIVFLFIIGVIMLGESL